MKIMSIFFLYIGLIMNYEACALTVVNWQEALKNAIPDSIAGIKIAPLTCNDSFSLYITEIPAHGHITAHYHKHDLETYEIIAGKGIMHTGFLQGDEVIWNESVDVKAGDVFTIEPGIIHQLQNPFNESLILLFGCPKSHLSTDRYVTKSHNSIEK